MGQSVGAVCNPIVRHSGHFSFENFRSMELVVIHQGLDSGGHTCRSTRPCSSTCPGSGWFDSTNPNGRRDELLRHRPFVRFPSASPASIGFDAGRNSSTQAVSNFASRFDWQSPQFHAVQIWMDFSCCATFERTIPWKDPKRWQQPRRSTKTLVSFSNVTYNLPKWIQLFIHQLLPIMCLIFLPSVMPSSGENCQGLCIANPKMLPFPLPRRWIFC